MSEKWLVQIHPPREVFNFVIVTNYRRSMVFFSLWVRYLTYFVNCNMFFTFSEYSICSYFKFGISVRKFGKFLNDCAKFWEIPNYEFGKKFGEFRILNSIMSISKILCNGMVTFGNISEYLPTFFIDIWRHKWLNKSYVRTSELKKCFVSFLKVTSPATTMNWPKRWPWSGRGFLEPKFIIFQSDGILTSR